MVKPSDFVVRLQDIDRDDAFFVGSNAAHVGEMIHAQFLIPQGFVITSHSYFTFIHENKLDVKIKHLLNTINFSEPNSVRQVSSHIRKLINTTKVPDEIIKSVFSFYEKMGSNNYISIRTSPISKTSAHYETILNIKGEAAIIEKMREAWSMLFDVKSVIFRHEHKIDHQKAGTGLIIQKMIESDASGIMLTVDPITGEKTKMIIESILGQSEYLLRRKVVSDHYEVDKKQFTILKKEISEQKSMFAKGTFEHEEKKVPQNLSKAQKITDEQIISLAKLGVALEKHNYFPQDVEWAAQNGVVYIVQTHQITIGGLEKSTSTTQAEPVLVGHPVHPGIGIGTVRIAKSSKDTSKVKAGDILVTTLTNPEYIQALKKASAIITEHETNTSYIAFVSRELGIPAIAGVTNATKILSENSVYTVNGTTGQIYKGSILKKHEKDKKLHEPLKTKTQLFVIGDVHELTTKLSPDSAEGLGLLHAESILKEMGVHPKKIIHNKTGKVFVDRLSKSLEEFSRSFYPRDAFYRIIDFQTNELRVFEGGKEFETVEENPIIGFRGAYRHVHNAELLSLELEAIKKVRKTYANLHLIIPFVRTVKELEFIKKMISSHGLHSSNFKQILTIEVPSNVISIEEFIAIGIDGIVINSDVLATLILGVDQKNHEIAHEFNEQDEAVLWSFERVIKASKKHGISSSIYGKALQYPAIVRKLVDWGITSICIPPEVIDHMRMVIHSAEK